MTTFLTMDEVGRFCPAALTDRPQGDRSSRFGHISTMECLEIFGDEGWRPTEAMAKDYDDPFGIHMVKLRHETGRVDNKTGTEREALVFNAHNGKKSFLLLGGLFRFACANGIVVGDVQSTLRQRHVGSTDVETLVAQALDTIEAGLADAESWLQRELALDELQDLGRRCAERVYGPDWVTDTLVNNLVAHCRRPQDLGTDLWRSFNRIQENVLVGGLVRGLNESGRISTTRGISDFVRRGRVNKQIWNVAQTFAA